MPMGIVSDSELEVELARNGVKESLVPPPTHGRTNGDKNVPDALRKVIADDHVENGRASAVDLAASFGISSSSVSAYAKGATSTSSYHSGNGELKKHVNSTKIKIATKAKKRLGWALSAITEEKLQEASLKVAASVAKDMSVIIKQMEPDDAGVEKNTNVQVVLFAPRPMSEEDFPTIRVKD